MAKWPIQASLQSCTLFADMRRMFETSSLPLQAETEEVSLTVLKLELTPSGMKVSYCLVSAEVALTGIAES